MKMKRSTITIIAIFLTIIVNIFFDYVGLGCNTLNNTIETDPDGDEIIELIQDTSIENGFISVWVA